MASRKSQPKVVRTTGKSKCSADLFCRSAAFAVSWEKPRTYKTGPRYTLGMRVGQVRPDLSLVFPPWF
jgi:hypothetical protein